MLFKELFTELFTAGFHLQSCIIFKFCHLDREGRESEESNLRSERYEEIRKILIKIAQGSTGQQTSSHLLAKYKLLIRRHFVFYLPLIGSKS